MSDLTIAASIVGVVSVATFLATVSLARRLPRRLCDALAAGIVILMGFYIRDVWDHMFVAEWLPYSSLIILGNWFPPGIAILAGLAWVRVPPPAARKGFVLLLLIGSAAYSVYHPFRGEVPECENRWNGTVCLQTTQDTCSAACAATLLRHHGISANEQEMAELCMTRAGTTWWGLYRGLKLKSAGTDWEVKVVSGEVAKLTELAGEGTIVFVRLTAEAAERYPKFLEEGWIVGTSHSVVLFEVRKDGRCLVGDPSFGLEVWPLSHLELLYQGRGMRLVKRVP